MRAAAELVFGMGDLFRTGPSGATLPEVRGGAVGGVRYLHARELAEMPGGAGGGVRYLHARELAEMPGGTGGGVRYLDA
jgi:hypothetical protein